MRTTGGPPFGRAPWGLLGMAVLVAAVELHLAHRTLDFMSLEAFEWGTSARAARRAAPGAAILCFGDSQLKTGIVPRVIAAETGRPAYNLAVHCGQATSSYFLLRRALEAGARPAAILVDFKPHLLTMGPGLTRDRWPDFLSVRELLELSWAARDPRFFAAVGLARLLPSVRDRVQIRGEIVAALGGAGGGRRFGLLSHLRNVTVNRGAVVMTPRPWTPPPVDPGDAALYPTAWQCERTNALYLRRFLALAAARRIPVFWILPPSLPEVQARREWVGADAAYLRFVRRAVARFPGVRVVDGRHSAYAPAVFADPLHLDRRGAVAFSAAVAEVLRRPAGSTPRWAVLPPYRDRPDGVPLEDVDQSQLALQRRAARRR
jgi:hypothetical protein